ncbi:MAG: signal peptidase I [Chloroflexota bacterium]
METRTIRLVRRTVGLLWAVLLIGVLGLVAANQIAPRLGYQTFIIRGGSMEPTIPLGSLIGVANVDPASLVPGDVITVESQSGVVYSHRIVTVDGRGADLRFQLKGDNNDAPDAAFVSAHAVVGRMAFQAPILGSLLAILALPIGKLSMLICLASLLLAYWVLDAIERHVANEKRTMLVDPAGVPQAG